VPGETSLSYSRLKTLNECPRKFQLRELAETGQHSATIHTAFGSAFGVGVQQLFKTGSIALATIHAIAAWNLDHMQDPWGKEKNKSIFHCIESLAIYAKTLHRVLSAEFQLAQIAIPAIEPLVYLRLPHNYNYQVHIDLILQHRVTKELVTAEIKTSSRRHTPAMWQNSLQTRAYREVLKAVAAKHGYQVSPEILYITLQTGKLDDPLNSFGFHHFRFEELIASDFTLSILQIVSILSMYAQDNHYPKHGESCESMFGVCQYFGICDEIPTAPSTGQIYETLTLEDADCILSIEELLDGNST
jgi:hypothetical protein